MFKILDIAQLGNLVLRQIAQPINNINDPNIQLLIDSLQATMNLSKGVGIAAPQVAQSYRIFITASHPNARYPHAPLMQPIAMINPKIVAHSSEIIKDWEGCLSLPNVRGLVPRYQTIEVEYIDRYGDQQHQELTDFVARIFQHELDHLNGILFIDRVESTQDLFSESEYQKIIPG